MKTMNTFCKTVALSALIATGMATACGVSK